VTAGAYSNDKSAHTIHEFSPNVLPEYNADGDHLPVDHRTKHYRSNDMHRRPDDYSIFEKKRSPSDCTYDSDNDNVSMRCSY